ARAAAVEDMLALVAPHAGRLRHGAQAAASVAEALDAARAELAAAGIEPEYLEARDADDLSPIEAFNGRPVLVAVAAQVGRARLIDNLVIEEDRAGGEERES
ncbi:MAG: pantoate--beta-alanine ligase, partial [Solirubrobacterales bacterium]